MKRSFCEMETGYWNRKGIWNIESRMRKQAAMELEEQKRQPVFVSNVRINSKGDAGHTLDCLPPNTIYLGGENFVSVSEFVNQTRVHIRRYVFDQEGFIHPTKQGISVSPATWNSLCIHMNRATDEMTIVDRKVCISMQKKEGKTLFIFQRLFQRKDMSFHFVPNCAVLSDTEFANLTNSISFITNKVKDSLIHYTLLNFIQEELSEQSQTLRSMDTTSGFAELQDSLSKCLCIAITLKISEQMDCFGCRENYEADFMHECKTKSRADIFAEYFERALYNLNLKDVAKTFVQHNINVDLYRILFEDEFFDYLNVTELFKDVEKMYVSEEEENVNN